MHVDDFIDGPISTDQGERFAKWFFALHRFPAVLKMQVAPWMDKYKLYCTYQGKRWRVTGCSRMGDVWLALNFDREIGYDARVRVDDCSEWGQLP